MTCFPIAIAGGQGTSGNLLISISDTGIGLPPRTGGPDLQSIFTTNPQGTGLGLSISRPIVESHGGRLWATANSGRGATFQFTLPSKGEVRETSQRGNAHPLNP